MRTMKSGILLCLALGLGLMLTSCEGPKPTLPGLVIIVQPGDTVRGGTITPPVQVELRGVEGNRVATADNTVTIALGTNPGEATLHGTLSRLAVNGLATFDDLMIDKKGRSYTLVVRSPGLPQVVTESFNILDEPIKLAYAVQPQNTTAGETITPDIVVEVQNSLGERVDSASHPITLAIENNPSAGTLGGHPHRNPDPNRRPGHRHLQRPEPRQVRLRLYPSRQGRRVDPHHQRDLHHPAQTRHPHRLYRRTLQHHSGTADHPGRRRGGA